MDIVIGGAMLVVLMLCLGFGWGDIALLGAGIVGIIIVLIGGFFAVCLVMLAFSRRKSAVFVRFTEQSDRSEAEHGSPKLRSFSDKERRFPCAVYRIDGADVVNMFPCEMVMRNKLYIPEKEIKVLYFRPFRSAVDSNALLTIILGSVIFIPSAVFAVYKMAEVIGGMLG